VSITTIVYHLKEKEEEGMQSLMKPMFFVLIAVLGAVVAIAPAHAESDSRVLVNIPFDFSVGNTPLKAGNYKVEELRSGILAFSSQDGQGNQFALTIPGESANSSHKPKLVFTRYGNEMFLSKIFLSGDDDCRQPLPSSREKKLIQERSSGEELSLLIQPAR
jgi:hypothetical protein